MHSGTRDMELELHTQNLPRDSPLGYLLTDSNENKDKKETVKTQVTYAKKKQAFPIS
jgi:hypothetical protein